MSEINYNIYQYIQGTDRSMTFLILKVVDVLPTFYKNENGLRNCQVCKD